MKAVITTLALGILGLGLTAGYFVSDEAAVAVVPERWVIVPRPLLGFVVPIPYRIPRPSPAPFVRSKGGTRDFDKNRPAHEIIPADLKEAKGVRPPAK